MPNRFQNLVLLLAAIMLISVALYLTKDIMVPFVFALSFVYAIQPAIVWTGKIFRIKRRWATIIFLIAFSLVFITIFIGVGSSLKQIIFNSQQYQERVVQLFEFGSAFMENRGIPIDINENLKSYINELPLFGYLSRISQFLVKGISDFTLIAIFILFLISGEPFVLPKSGIYAKVNASIRSYLTTKVLTSSATGLLTGLFLMAIDLDMAVMFGFLAFLLNFIPTVGSIIATLLPIPVAVLQFTNPWLIMSSIAVPGSLQFIIGNIIEPKLIGQNLDLHPVTVLLTLMFWGFLWGIPGMLLATPITVILKIILANHKPFFAYSELMAGRIKFFNDSADKIQES